MEIDKALFDFIQEHAGDDPASLLLRYSGKTEFPLHFAVEQLECRKRYRQKIGRYIENPHFLFPTKVAGEQASHQAVARYHASLVSKEARKIADLTAGLGIDAMTMAETHPEAQVTAIELDEWKARILRHNAEVLGIKNLSAIHADSMEWVTDTDILDVAFIDPHRRDSKGGRVYALSDCVPDICEHLKMLMSRTHRLIIKASPMLDVVQTLREIPDAVSIRAVCFKGECKEILVEAETGGSLRYMEAVDLNHEGVISCVRIPCDAQENLPCGAQQNCQCDAQQNLSCGAQQHQSTDSVGATVTSQSMEKQKGNPMKIEEEGYLYIPNAGIMKLAPWEHIKHLYPSLQKISDNTHVWYGEQLIHDFPGEKFRIISSLDSKALKRLKGAKLNVISRNHPDAADAITSRLKLKSSDTDYLIAIRSKDGKPAIYRAERIA